MSDTDIIHGLIKLSDWLRRTSPGDVRIVEGAIERLRSGRAAVIDPEALEAAKAIERGIRKGCGFHIDWLVRHAGMVAHALIAAKGEDKA